MTCPSQQHRLCQRHKTWRSPQVPRYAIHLSLPRHQGQLRHRVGYLTPLCSGDIMCWKTAPIVMHPIVTPANLHLSNEYPTSNNESTRSPLPLRIKLKFRSIQRSTLGSRGAKKQKTRSIQSAQSTVTGARSRFCAVFSTHQPCYRICH